MLVLPMPPSPSAFTAYDPQLCPFELVENSPNIVSPNLGCPKIFALTECEAEKSTLFHFYMNVVAPKGMKAEYLQNQLQVHLVPLYNHDPQTRRLIRGAKIPVTILHATEKNALMIYDEDLIHLYHLNPARPSYLLRHDFFGLKSIP